MNMNGSRKPKYMTHRLVRRAEHLLSAEGRSLLVDLLEGRRFLMRIAGRAYAARLLDTPADTTLLGVRAVDDGSPEYNVAVDFCSCPSSKFRGHVCKHMEALRRLYP